MLLTTCGSSGRGRQLGGIEPPDRGRQRRVEQAPVAQANWQDRAVDETDRPAGGDHEVTRDVVYYDDGQPAAELTAWLREQLATAATPAARGAEHVLDYFDQKCSEAVTSPGVELECRLLWSVIQRLALPYEDQSGYRPEWRP
jgi:hypothetical protein